MITNDYCFAELNNANITAHQAFIWQWLRVCRLKFC